MILVVVICMAFLAFFVVTMTNAFSKINDLENKIYSLREHCADDKDLTTQDISFLKESITELANRRDSSKEHYSKDEIVKIIRDVCVDFGSKKPFSRRRDNVWRKGMVRQGDAPEEA